MTTSFNEAAADDRGKRRPGRRSWTRAVWRFNEAAADDRGKQLNMLRSEETPNWAGFNEAAADDRGKPGHPPDGVPAGTRFNEAAADDRGKPAGAAAWNRTYEQLQ